MEGRREQGEDERREGCLPPYYHCYVLLWALNDVYVECVGMRTSTCVLQSTSTYLYASIAEDAFSRSASQVYSLIMCMCVGREQGG